MFNMNSLDYKVYHANKLNAELSELTTGTTELRLLVENTLDTLTQLEELAIAKTGGYTPGNKGLRTHLVNPELANRASLIRDNELGVTKDYINRVANYLNEKGMDVGLTAMDAGDDPYYSKDPNFDRIDFFDLAFDQRNIYQVIAMIGGIKLDILELERRYVQAQLKEQIGNENDL